MKFSEYQRLKSRIEKAYREELLALNLLWKKHGEPSQRNSGSSARSDGDGSIKNIISEAILTHDGEFTINDLEQWIQINKSHIGIKRPTIRVILNRLTGKKVQVVKAGQGRSPNIYKAVK